MLEVLFSSGALNIVYTLVFAISFIFALISLVGAELGDLFDFDFGGDGDGAFDFISISPFSLAMFGATFGLTGLVTRLWLEMETIPSILWAAAIGIIFGIAAQVLFISVLSPSKSSHFSLADDAAGREAEVIITIPAHGRGSIAYDNVSGRVTLGARSSTGKPIKRGEFVTIERIIGRIAVVQAKEN